MTYFEDNSSSQQNVNQLHPSIRLPGLTDLKLVTKLVSSGLLILLVVLTWLSLAPPQLATAQTGDSSFVLAWSSAGSDPTTSVAWGDYDGDGDLDLAVGNNYVAPTQLYRNNAGTLTTTPVWSSISGISTSSVAWGDVDNDGDLDLALGNWGANHLYRNDGVANDGTPIFNLAWTSAETDGTTSIAWGDFDGDGDLDLAVGNTRQYDNGCACYVNGYERLYRNDSGTLTANAVWSSNEADWTQAIAWGDYDGDDDLDLAVGNIPEYDNGCACYVNGYERLYRNDGGTLTTNAVWSSNEVDWTHAVTWGDYDGDDDLDLAVGNNGEPNRLYCNDNATLTPCWSAASTGTRSLAWGDSDGDGDLDLVVGNSYGNAPRVRLYCNDNATLTDCWSSTLDDNTYSVAWGDVDGDGDLDLAVGNIGQPNRLYYNDSGALTDSAVWSLAEPLRNIKSVAWGDVDGDSDLDLAIGDEERPNQLFMNVNGVLTAAWSAALAEKTQSVAWGDVDGDGDLDLAAGNKGQPNRLYRNDSGTLTANAVWSSMEADDTTSVAWGDVDGDGDLDLAVGNGTPLQEPVKDPNRLYRNDNGQLTAAAVWSSVEADSTEEVAWGDYDSDGDLDLAVGNFGAPNRLYRNDGGELTPSAVWSSIETDNTMSVAWGDYDGDGDLDLAVGNQSQPNRLYRNDGGVLTPGAVWSSVEADGTSAIAWGDYDGDGDLDLGVANEFTQPNRLYRNDRGTLRVRAVWSSVETTFADSIAWGDADGDGDLDLASGGANYIRLYLTQTPAHPFPPGQTAAVGLNLYSDATPTFSQTVTALAPANFYAIPGIRVGTTIPISYTISDPEAGSTWRVRGFFSPDGGGRWFPAVASSGTITRNVASGVEQVYRWDVGASGFFGQSDNIVFRLEVLPGGPLPSQRPYVTAHTYPFRVQGTQVRVIKEVDQPVQGALVYRLPAGQTSGGQPLGGADTPFRTSPQGYLSGRGQLNIGDQLMALWPVTQTDKYILYHTSAAITETEPSLFVVTQTGVQTLTVSTANPLLLFNLTVSLEWDASNDPLFLDQLEQNLAKTSEELYDWTNGQVALGRVTVYQDKQGWDEADLRIFASNQIRPIANRGGIVTATTVLTHPAFTEPITAAQGEIRIGPTWNRYGDPQPIGDDWPRVLAHELGHYALFLEDTYLGLDENSGLLIPVDSCTSTAMSDPYDDISSEFRYNDPNWQANCGETLAELPDWDLITLVYPPLNSPPPINSGPATLPFAFTQIELTAAPGQPQPLLNDFNIALDENLSDGRAYLRHPGQRLVDLGRPILNSILARGAREGDELCIFAAGSFACSQLSNSGPPQLTLRPTWQPEIILTPVSSTTVQILVNNANATALTATFYPNGQAPQQETVTPGVAQTVTLSQPAVEVLLDLVGNDPSTQRLVTSYAAGAGPGRTRGHGGPGRTRGHGGPFASGDGSVLIYPPEDLPDDVFMVLQTATSLPQLPAGLTPIGRGYNVRTSTVITDFTGASLNFQYLGLDVLLSQKPEQSLAVHFWDGSTWRRLQTILNTTQNFASAPLPLPGLYVLTAGQVTPAITAVSPISGDSGLTHTLTITGQNFLNPLAVTLRGQTSLNYPLTVISVNTQTVMAVTPLTLPVDLYNLELTNAGDLTATQASAFALYTAQPGACFFDDFASGWGKWTRTGEWDIVTTNGQEAATDSPAASYLNAEPGLTRTTTITSQSFSLAACPNPGLSFRHDYVLAIGPASYQDFGTMEISTDNGATWRNLDTYSGGGGYNLTAAADEWSNVNWQRVSLSLAQPGVPTNTTTARLRFNLIADAVGSDKGWIIDQVIVETCPSQGCAPSQLKIYLPIIVK